MNLRPAGVRRRVDRFPFMGWLLMLAMAMGGCVGAENTHAMDIPEGPATETLREFARQTEVEILFDLQSVSGVRTHGIKGRYEPVDALRMMLENTALKIDLDHETGAFAVVRQDYSVPPQ